LALRAIRGSAAPEFASALAIFVCCLLVPVIDLAIVPIRYVLACGLVSELAHRVALSERPSEVYALAMEKSWFRNFAQKSGVKFGKLKTSIICNGHGSESYVVPQGEKIPSQWLPNGSKAPCSYMLQLNIDTEIAPLITGGPPLPAITAPVKLTLTGNAHWENLGRDPDTSEYYINE
jgi:hypothetical protein